MKKQKKVVGYMPTNEITNIGYGSCAKHPYHNMIDCPECNLEKFQESPDYTFPEWLKRRIKIDIPKMNLKQQLSWYALTVYMYDQEAKGETEFKIVSLGLNKGYKVSCINFPKRKPLIIDDNL